MYRTKKNISYGIIILFAAFTINTALNAQRVELTPFVGYETSGRMYTSIGYLRIDDGMNFGGALSIGVDASALIEFSYNHMRSKLSLDEGAFNTEYTDIDVDYYMLGVVKELLPGQKVTPFGSGALGLVNYRCLDSKYSSEQQFAVNLAGGIRVHLSERVGLRLQARLLLPMYFSGLYFGAGTGGASAGISGGSTMVQGDFTGSLFFAIR